MCLFCTLYIIKGLIPKDTRRIPERLIHMETIKISKTHDHENNRRN